MPAKPDIARAGIALGIGLYLTGVFFFAANDALGKWLVFEGGAEYGVAQLLFIRTFGGLLLMLPFVWHTKASLALKGSKPLHLLRILAQTGDSFCFYFSTKTMPLADVMTFYMAGPIIITAVSGLFLGERVGPYRWGAVLFGFVGVVIALAPTSETFSPTALIALTGSTLFGISVAMTRRLRDTHPLSLTIWQFVGSGIIGLILCPLDWVTPSVPDFGLMLVVGLVAAGSFFCIARALALAPASLLAPFQYSAIFWAAVMGWLVFHDTPTPRIFIGNAILIASGLFVFYRERRLAISVSDKVEPIP